MANMSFANNAATTLASGINTSVTSLTVASGTGTLFPTLTGSQYFYCTLESVAGTSREIVKVTARSTDTFTIARGQDGTTGTAFSTGDKVELRLVRANLTDFALLDEVNTFSQQQTFSSGIKFSDATTQTTASIPGVLGQAFTSSGTFTIPSGVTALKVTVVGGGGGGSSGYNNIGGRGGSGGGIAISYLTSLTPTSTIAVTVGGAGGQSKIASGTQTITTVTVNGAGGTVTGGTINMVGGSSSSAGQDGSAGASSLFGGSGAGSNGTTGGNATSYGAGGGGGYGYNNCGVPGGYAGGSGYQGIVIFEW